MVNIPGVEGGGTGPPTGGVPPGGRTGQILAKASDADFDLIWVNPPTPSSYPYGSGPYGSGPYGGT